ncbi:hypothetical protein GHT06_015759 [Daphnia sinensis]|uniref:Uncharacterized protein n=1 Tax=Daphnia sinensis TaxID=1820382 RepID=A0AAD5LAC0_9CRUS|nr:hypothetical protein GHT06_015759 [Daphnia sinensis]
MQTHSFGSVQSWLRWVATRHTGEVSKQQGPVASHFPVTCKKTDGNTQTTIFCIPPDIHARSSTVYIYGVCVSFFFPPDFLLYALPPFIPSPPSLFPASLARCCSCAPCFFHFASVSLGGGRKEGSAFWFGRR